MEKHKVLKEIFVVFIASIVFAIAVSFPSLEKFYYSFYSFFIIIFVAGLTKKAYAYYLEADTKLKFWSMYQFGFKKIAHFRKPLPMVWVPLVLAPINFLWLGILETEIIARTERVSKRHGLYRFSEMTDWHMALIALVGLISTLGLAFIGYWSNFELFSKLAIYYAVWSIIPIGGLDGTKLLFGSRFLWTAVAIFMIIVFGWSLVVL